MQLVINTNGSYLKKNRPEIKDELQEYINNIEKLRDDLSATEGTLDDLRGRLMGLEGMASRTYFEALSLIMPDMWKFEGRSINPAVDEFNCLLNYGYGVLYSMVEKACIIAGLDPYVGFIQYKKLPSSCFTQPLKYRCCNNYCLHKKR